MDPEVMPQNLFKSRITKLDPGNAGHLVVDRTPCYFPLVSSTAETRTLDRPTKEGLEVILVGHTVGGTITVTVTGNYNADGDSTFSIAATLQFIKLASVKTGTTYSWRKLADHTSANLNPTELAYLSGLTAGTAAASKAMVTDSGNKIGSLTGLIVGATVTQQTISNGDGSTANVPAQQILGTTKALSSLLVGSFSATATTVAAPSINFLKSANATLGSNTVVASGEILGEINFFGADGTDFNSAAGRIACVVDATPGTGDMPGKLVFSTSIDGGETLTQAVTINNAQTMTCLGGLIAKSTQAAAITGARVLTAADSGGIFSVAKTSAYAITLPTPAQGIRFKFVGLDTGANAVTISDGSAHLLGMVSVNNVNTAMTGTTLTLASAGSIGDWVEFCGIDATHYLVTGACKDAADIAIA